jgi:hypothetical protein
LRIESDEGSREVVDLTKFPHTRGADGTVSVPVTFDAIHGRKLLVTITDMKPRVLRTSAKQKGVLLPSAIAELGIPGVQRKAVPAQLPAACINDLVTIDGKPFPVRVTGSTTDALRPRLLSMQPCHASQVVKLAAGTHEISAGESPHSTSALDVEHLLFSSAAGGAAVAPPLADTGPARVSDAQPTVQVVHEGKTSMTVHVGPTSKPFWFVLGQSLNRGWVAKADGHSLGESRLVDGYANGWLVQPSATGKAMTITLDWAPQRVAVVAILLSALGLLLCLGIVIAAFVRDRRRRYAFATGTPPILRRTLVGRALERRRGAVIGTVVAMTVAAALLITPWAGPIVGAAVLLAILRPRWRAALRLAPAVIVGAAALYVTIVQLVQNYAAVIQWPKSFDLTRVPVWIALLLLAADGVIALVWGTEFDEPEPERGAP